MQPVQQSLSNQLLSAMSASDFALLGPHLSPVDLARGDVLDFPGQTIEYAWFLEDGIASMVIASRDGHEVEAGIVGREGLIDVATILGVKESPLGSFIQIPGHGYRMPAQMLAAACQASETLRTLLNRFAFSMLIQIAETALSNASFSIEERLARWLLMCADRLVGEEIAMTHEFLSLMLNVRRAGVTMAIQSLQSAGYLESRRGRIRITDRPGLEEFASDAYTALR
ncbi:MAG: Crp/Fnr family transcriptional regulator [Novosphingobium sp.]